MNCKNGHVMLAEAVLCRTCVEEQDRRALRNLQFEYLRKAIDGEWNYLLRVVRGPDHHVLMFSSRTKTFCSKELPQNRQVEPAPYNDITLAKICAGCKIAIEGMVREALAQ